MLSTWSFLFFSSCASFSTSPAFSYLADCNSGSADAEEESELKIASRLRCKKGTRAKTRGKGGERRKYHREDEEITRQVSDSHGNTSRSSAPAGAHLLPECGKFGPADFFLSFASSASRRARCSRLMRIMRLLSMFGWNLSIQQLQNAGDVFKRFKDARSTQNFSIILLDIEDTQTDPRIYFEDFRTLGIEFRYKNRNSDFETELRCQKSESDKRDN